MEVLAGRENPAEAGGSVLEPTLSRRIAAGTHEIESILSVPVEMKTAGCLAVAAAASPPTGPVRGPNRFAARNQSWHLKSGATPALWAFPSSGGTGRFPQSDHEDGRVLSRSTVRAPGHSPRVLVALSRQNTSPRRLRVV
jgi:hypothetical protein